MKPKPSAVALTYLGGPKPLRVHETREQQPRAVFDQGRWVRVTRIQDRWTVGPEGWWRPDDQQEHRMYYEVLLETDSVWTIYRDLIRHTWHRQPYGVGHAPTAVWNRAPEPEADDAPEDRDG